MNPFGVITLGDRATYGGEFGIIVDTDVSVGEILFRYEDPDSHKAYGLTSIEIDDPQLELA